MALPAAGVRAINELATTAPTVRLLGTPPGQQLTRPVLVHGSAAGGSTGRRTSPRSANEAG